MWRTVEVSDVLALLISDLHLSHDPPVARSAEPDWYEAMARPLRQVKALQDKYGCPVICAGDIFDRHDARPPLVNWAIANMPAMYAIPGQHDLPMHRYQDLVRSAYWTLVQANTIYEMSDDVESRSWELACFGTLRLFGTPWGQEIIPLGKADGKKLNILVAHRYVWTTGKGYVGAKAEDNATSLRSKLKGYDVAVFGDNHQRFMKTWTGGCLYNCGCLIPRKSDERKQTPAVGLLHSDGRITTVELDCSEDRWLDAGDGVGVEAGTDNSMREFLDGLEGLDDDSLDFREAVERYMRDDEGMQDDVKRILTEVMER